MQHMHTYCKPAWLRIRKWSIKVIHWQPAHSASSSALHGSDRCRGVATYMAF